MCVKGHFPSPIAQYTRDLGLTEGDIGLARRLFIARTDDADAP